MNPMRCFFTLILWLLISPLFSQEENNSKYQSLFWKIEGKGMKEASYLYGTMHVSHKIAYHLNDQFYQALKDVDQIGLETNPEDWMDQMLESKGHVYGNTHSLYEVFPPEFINKDNYKNILKQNDQIVNGILYRNNASQQNFEEETYLDMFIYQAGGKLNKPVIALEDLNEADDLTRKAALNAFDPDKQFSSWLKKKLQDKGIIQLTEDAYRDQNLDLIDSLNIDYYPDKYNEYMLYQRNRNIVEAMDSVMEKGSLFAGIGAAHLPGKDGVIEYLREEGYTVKPITGNLTPKGQRLKEEFENNFASRKHKTYQTSDGFISVSLPEKLYEYNYSGRNVAVGMDITNGAYFLISRTPSYDLINKEKFGLDEIEEMLYENIPGKIEKQERIQFQGYPAIAIQNKTKNGESQRYLIVQTPLEIILFKLAGKKDYAKKFGNRFFDHLKFKNLKNDPKSVSPYFGDFEVKMPGDAIIIGNNENSFINKPLEIQSKDKNGGFYFAKELVFHDNRYLEEDDFEMEYIHKKWYDNIDTSYQVINYIPSSEQFPYPHCFSASETQAGKKINLFSLKKGPRYYLLGTIDVDSMGSFDFFNSFNFIPFKKDDEKYEIKKDTSLYFSVKSPVNAPPFFDLYGSRQIEDTLASKYKFLNFETPYKEKIKVSYNKYHHYYETENPDSLWADIARDWQKELKIINKEKGTDKNGHPFFKLQVGKKNCSRVIHNHYVLNHGVMYLIQYGEYMDSPPSEFIDTFLQTFTLLDTLIGMSPFEHKSENFFRQINSPDSLTRINTLKSFPYIQFKTEDVPELIKTIEEFDFKEEELEIKVGLLEKLGKINDIRIFPFLKNMYVRSEENSLIQLEVIKALAKNPNDRNYRAIIELLKTDIPLASERSIYTAFAPLKDSTSLEHSAKIFPELMTYSSIYEYKVFVFNLAAKLKNEGFLKTKIIKKYKGLLTNEMKIEYKRTKSRELKNKSNYYPSNQTYPSTTYTPSYNIKKSSLLDKYVTLLSPFHNEPQVREIFDKIKTLDDAGIKSLLQAQMAKHNSSLDKKLIHELAKDPSTRLNLFRNFKYLGQLEKFPKDYHNQRDIGEAYLFNNSGYPQLDTLEFYKETEIKDKDDEYVIYFFKTVKKDNNKKDNKEFGLQYIAYKLEKEEKTNFLRPYKLSSYKEMDFEDEKELRKFEEETIENVKYKKRKRITNYNPNNRYLGYYPY